MSTNQSPVPVCKICTRPFEDPRILSCLHSFCQACLEKELAKTPGNIITCPTCQRSVPIPEGGVISLPKNLHLTFEVEVASYIAAMETTSSIKCSSCSVESNGPSKAFCCTCREFLCQFCWDYHKASRKLQDHVTLSLGEDTPKKLHLLMKPNECCTVHKNEAVKFYCRECDRFICQDCVLVQHLNHNAVGLPAIVNEHRDELEVTLTSVLNSLGELRVGIASIEERIRHMGETRTKVTLSVKDAFEKLHKVLDERCGQLLEKVETLTSSKVESLCAQKEVLCKIEDNLTACSQMTSQVLQTHTDCEVVALKRLLPMEVGSLLGGAFPLSVKFHSDVTFNVDTDMLEKFIAQFGIVDNCSPAESSWAQVQTSPPMVNTQYQVKLVSKDSKGDRVTSGGLDVAAELRPKMANQPCTRGEVEDCGDGTYAITFTPLTAGHHQLSITIHGHHVLHSPCDLIVLSTGRDYGKLDTASAVVSVSAPYNVAVHDNGDIYVTGGSNYIRVFDVDGCNKYTVGGGGNGDGHFYNPRGITVQGDRLYIADDSNNRIQVLTVGGEFVHKFGQLGAALSCFNGTMDVCLDALGRMYVADYNNHRVQVFKGDGAFLYSVSGNVSGSGSFSFPWGVALDPKGNIHVVAWGTESVKVFSSGGPSGPAGAFIRMYGTLNHPTGIAIDNAGFSFVTDYGTNSLSVFDAQGNLKHVIRGLNRPYGVAVDKNGFVYVANSGTNQVLRY